MPSTLAMSSEDTSHENLLLVQHLPVPYGHTLRTEMGTQSRVPREPAAGSQTSHEALS